MLCTVPTITANASEDPATFPCARHDKKGTGPQHDVPGHSDTQKYRNHSLIDDIKGVMPMKWNSMTTSECSACFTLKKVQHGKDTVLYRIALIKVQQTSIPNGGNGHFTERIDGIIYGNELYRSPSQPTGNSFWFHLARHERNDRARFGVSFTEIPSIHSCSVNMNPTNFVGTATPKLIFPCFFVVIRYKTNNYCRNRSKLQSRPTSNGI